MLFLEQMSDPFSLFMWLLIVLSIIPYALTDDSNALFLAIILFITIITSAIVSYNFTKDSEDMLKKFQDIVPQYANIMRNGALKTIKS